MPLIALIVYRNYTQKRVIISIQQANNFKNQGIRESVVCEKKKKDVINLDNKLFGFQFSCQTSGLASIHVIQRVIVQYKKHIQPAAIKVKFSVVDPHSPKETIIYNCRLYFEKEVSDSTKDICDYELDPHSAGFDSAFTSSEAGSFSLKADSSSPGEADGSSPGEADGSSRGEAPERIGFLSCTKIMVILSHPSPPAVGAKHRSRTLSHTTESLDSYKLNLLGQLQLKTLKQRAARYLMKKEQKIIKDNMMQIDWELFSWPQPWLHC